MSGCRPLQPDGAGSARKPVGITVECACVEGATGFLLGGRGQRVALERDWTFGGGPRRVGGCRDRKACSSLGPRPSSLCSRAAKKTNSEAGTRQQHAQLLCAGRRCAQARLVPKRRSGRYCCVRSLPGPPALEFCAPIHSPSLAVRRSWRRFLSCPPRVLGLVSSTSLRGKGGEPQENGSSGYKRRT